jgi:hypothetical protein
MKLMRRLVRLPGHHVSQLMGLTLLGGAVMSAFYRVTGTQCPFRAVGLACPGCGCGRAVGRFVTDGAAAAFRAQPTASLLVLAILVAGFLPLIPERHLGRLRGGYLLLLPMATACLNFAWQLRAAVT